MITLIRPGGAAIVVNADLIETVERSSDATVVTLTTGNVLNVVDAPGEIVEAVVALRRRIAGH